MYKQILKSTGMYSIAVIAGKMASIFLMPIYTRYLTPADYGVLELLDLTSFIFSSFVGSRFNESLFYCASRTKTERERELTISTALIGTFIIGLIGGIVGCLSASLLSRMVFGSPDYARSFYLVFVAFGFCMPADMVMCYLQQERRSGTYVMAACFRLGFGILINVILVVGFHMGLRGILWGSAVTAAVMTLFTIAVMISHRYWRFSPRIFATQVRYSAPLGISGLGMLLVHFGDRFFLRRYVGLGEIGIYSIAYKVGMLISYIQMPFQLHWRAYVFEVAKAREGDTIFARTCTYMTLVLAFGFVGITAFVHPALRIMAGPEFRSAYVYVPWIALVYLVRALADYVRSVFLMIGATGREAQVTWVASAACVAAYAGLIPAFKVWGAIAATGIAFLLLLVLAYFRAQRLRKFHFEYGRLLKIGFACAAVMAVFLSVSPGSTLLQAVEGVGMLALFLGILAATRCFTADEVRAILALPKQAVQKVQAVAARA